MQQTTTKSVNWCTQQQLATELNVSVQRVHNWVRRKKIMTKLSKPANVVLVNKFTIKIKKYYEMCSY